MNVKRATTSFGQLLESLPNNQSKAKDREGLIILKASVQLLNQYCLRLVIDLIFNNKRFNKFIFCHSHSGYSSQQCATELSAIHLPESEARRKCEELQETNASNTYRRLLPANYVDGLYQVIWEHLFKEYLCTFKLVG